MISELGLRNHLVIPISFQRERRRVRGNSTREDFFITVRERRDQRAYTRAGVSRLRVLSDLAGDERERDRYRANRPVFTA